jgi:hypothetical protein
MTCPKTPRTYILMGLLCASLWPTTALGQLLVSNGATTGANEILQFGLTGAFEKQLVGPGSGLDGPSAMAFGNGSDLFVASKNNGKVLRFDRHTGQRIGDGVFAAGLNAPAGLLFDAASNSLFVSELVSSPSSLSYDGETIARFDATTGAPLPFSNGSFRFGAGTGAQGRTGMAMGPDGLYVASFSDGRVLRFDPTTGDPKGIISTDPSATPPVYFYGANAMVFDANGNLDVVGMFTNNVSQCVNNGAVLKELISTNDGGLAWPCAVAIAPDGNLLVSSLGDYTSSGYIGKYDPKTGAAIPLFHIIHGDLFQPTAMLFLPAPEPSSLALAMVGGLICLAWACRRRFFARMPRKMRGFRPVGSVENSPAIHRWGGRHVLHYLPSCRDGGGVSGTVRPSLRDLQARIR